MAGSDFHEQVEVGGGLGKKAKDVGRGRHSNNAVTGDSSVGRFYPEDAVKGSGLADGTACVGSSRELDAVESDSDGGTAGGGASHALGIESVFCWAEI